MIIGLSLTPVAIGEAEKGTVTAMITALIVIFAAIFGKGFFKIIPILLGTVGGYIVAILFGQVNFDAINKAAWIALPQLTIVTGHMPVLAWGAVALIAPVAIATMVEDVGHLLVIGDTVERDLMHNPGLHKVLLGNGIATAVAGFLGGVPETTYGENIGVLAITRVFSSRVIQGAAVIAILLSFIQKFGAAIQTIPQPVLGGVTIILYGMIASVGLRTLIENKVNMAENRNLLIVSVIFSFGVGGMVFKFGPDFAVRRDRLRGDRRHHPQPDPAQDKEGGKGLGRLLRRAAAARMRAGPPPSGGGPRIPGPDCEHGQSKPESAHLREALGADPPLGLPSRAPLHRRGALRGVQRQPKPRPRGPQHPRGERPHREEGPAMATASSSSISWRSTSSTTSASRWRHRRRASLPDGHGRQAPRGARAPSGRHPARLPEAAKTVAAADEEFHETLARLCGNKTLASTLKSVDRRIHFVRLADITTEERVRATCREHLELLDAIRDRDEARARDVLRKNIDGGRSSVERAIKDALAHAYHTRE